MHILGLSSFSALLVLLSAGFSYTFVSAADPFLSSSIPCSNDQSIQVLFDTCMTTSIHDSLNRLKPNIDSACGAPGSTTYSCCICSNYSAVELCFKQFCKDGMKLDANMLAKKKEHCTICYTANGLKKAEVSTLAADGDNAELQSHADEDEDPQKKLDKGKTPYNQNKAEDGTSKDKDGKNMKDEDKKSGKKDSSSGERAIGSPGGLVIAAALPLVLYVVFFTT